MELKKKFSTLLTNEWKTFCKQAPSVQMLESRYVTSLSIELVPPKHWFISWLVIYQMDSVMHSLNNWGFVFNALFSLNLWLGRSIWYKPHRFLWTSQPLPFMYNWLGGFCLFCFFVTQCWWVKWHRQNCKEHWCKNIEYS